MRVAGRNGPKSDPSFQGRRFYKKEANYGSEEEGSEEGSQKEKEVARPSNRNRLETSAEMRGFFILCLTQ
jgi:hypothetical protein